MFSKVASLLIFQRDQGFLQGRPAENINTHGRKITSWMLRFFFKLRNPSCFIGNHNTETACFLHRHRHRSDRYIRLVCLMVIQHHFIVHLINVVSGKNQHIVRIIAFHISHILENRVCCSRIPLAAFTFFIWRQNSYTTHVSVQIPRNTNSNVRIKTKGLVLGQYTNGIHAGINTVTERKVDNTVFSAKCHCRFCYFFS